MLVVLIENIVMLINVQENVNVDEVQKLIDQLLKVNHLYQEHVNEVHDVPTYEYLN